jgi:hypothetical protein
LSRQIKAGDGAAAACFGFADAFMVRDTALHCERMTLIGIQSLGLRQPAISMPYHRSAAIADM